MYRRAYVLLVGVAATMGILAIVAAASTHKGLTDPDGFLGPSWLRLPMLILAAFAVDLVPRTLWQSRLRFPAMPGIFMTRVRTHWTRERATLVVLGVLGFYITYVSYRNLKSFLPFVLGDTKYDRTLHLMDRALMFGHEPGVLLHSLLGTGFSAYFLSYVYLWFLPLVPLALTAWLVWSRNLSYGYWFGTSQVLAWTMGTISYYALPTLGPGIAYSYIYSSLPDTNTSHLMASLTNTRQAVVEGGLEDVVQSVAGFASLHCAITLLVALMVQFTLRSKILKTIFWVNFAFTIVATIYFGWHYIADDIAGIMIAFVSFYVGGLASGQKFHKHGLSSRPTTTTSAIPVDQDA